MIRLINLSTKWSVFAIGIALGACGAVKTILVKNTTDQPLENKCFTLAREELKLQGAGYVKLTTASGEAIPAQHDDLDGDGAWDELAFEYSLAAGGEATLAYLEVKEEELPDFEQKTNAYLGFSSKRDNNFVSVDYNERPADHVAQSVPFLYQYEGPGWESDLVAFRSYFDSRNGKDIFGKTKPQLKLETIGQGGDYHTLAKDWGMDVLKVGSSLGAGAIAMYKNDSIIRLGATGQASFRIISEGPVRSIIELAYKDWKVAGTSYDVTERITIWAGKRGYESSITLSDGNEGDTLVTGLVNLKGLASVEVKAEGYKVIYTHGPQSENKDVLGMALAVPEQNFGGFQEAPASGAGVTNSYTSRLLPHHGKYNFQFYAGWELENSAFKDQQQFEEEVVREVLASSGSGNVDITISQAE